MDKKTAQKLLHRHLHETQAVPWINESTSQRAFPLGAAIVQFVLSQGTDKEAINKLCYNLTALLGQIAAQLRHDPPVQRRTIKASIERAANADDVLDFEYVDSEVADAFAVTLVEHFTADEDESNSTLAALFGEALTVVAQTLNCVNNHEAWKEPQLSLLEACEQALEDPQGDWQVAVVQRLGDETWGNRLQEAAKFVVNPETRSLYWYNLQLAVEICSKQKCSQCYEPGSIRHSCGHYAGRYCDEHWETAGFRPASDRIDYLDAGEYGTEEEAY